MSIEDEKSNSLVPNDAFGKILNPKYVQRGIIIFVIITLLSFTALFLYNNSVENIKALSQVRFGYLFLALVFAFLDWFIGGLRNHIFVRLISPGISLKVCFNANLANIFLGAVTPSQSGGGGAQLYVLWRNGVKVTDGIAVAIINYISTIVFFMSSAGLAIWYLKNDINNSLISTLVTSGFTLFAVAMILIFISLIFPKKMGFVINRIVSRFSKKIQNKAQVLSAQLEHYHSTMLLFVMRKPLMLPFSFVMTSILYFNKYMIAYILILGLGVDPPFLTIIALQALIFFMLYFAPSPGASGIAEVSIAALMSQVLVESVIPSFTILHRVFLLLIPALLGAFVFLGELKKQAH